MLNGLSRQISKISNPSLSLPSDHPITPTDYVRNLSFIFESSLTFSTKISSPSSACNYISRPSPHQVHTRPQNSIRYRYFYSKLDCCNSLYLNLPQKQISRLQLLQNFLARAVTGTLKTEHITPVLKSLHLLKIKERIHYKIIFLT